MKLASYSADGARDCGRHAGDAVWAARRCPGCHGLSRVARGLSRVALPLSKVLAVAKGREEEGEREGGRGREGGEGEIKRGSLQKRDNRLIVYVLKNLYELQYVGGEEALPLRFFLSDLDHGRHRTTSHRT